MINWKIVAGLGALGALISLVFGLAGGNPFGIILLRLVVSAVFLGALGLGAAVLVHKFMPELGAAGRGAVGQEQVGGSAAPEVDIVIDEELPLTADSLLGEVPSEPEEAGGPVAGGEVSQGPEQEEAEEGEPAAELTEELAPLEEAVEVSTAAEAPAGSSWSTPGEQSELLDTLPGLEEEVAGPAEAASSGEAGATNDARRSRREQMEARVAGQDPVDLAKAVRTFMKKDQEG